MNKSHSRPAKPRATVILAALLTLLLASSTGCAGGDATSDGPIESANDAGTDGGGGVAADSGTSSGGTSSGGTSSGGTSSGGTSSGGSTDAGSTDAGGGVTLPSELVALTLEPAVATIPISASIALELTGKLADGTTVPLNDLAAWSTSSADILSVSQGGLALGVGAGSATITASIAGHFANAQIAVSAKTVQSLTVDPADATVAIGATTKFSAIATMSDGSQETVTESVAWSSANSAVATVSKGGVATGIAAGDSVITAKLGSHEVTANLNVASSALTSLAVEPVDPTLTLGESVQFTATATYADGSLADVTKAAKWTSSAPAIAPVNDTGSTTALATGTATVSAELGGFSDSRVVTVKSVQLSALEIAPATATVAAGGQQAFTVKGTFEDGTTKDFTSSVVWTVAPTGVAAISNAPGSSGTATGLASGTATVSATFGPIVAKATLTVTAATLKSLAIEGVTTVAKGVQKQLKALGTYSDGKVLDVTTKVTWQSSDTKIATVANAAPKGWMAAIKEGAAVISATLDGVTAKATVNVSAAALVNIVIDPKSATIEAGLKQNLTAKAQYSDGSLIDVTAQVVWNSSDPATVAVSNAKGTEGLISALKAGSVTIGAALGTTTAKITVTVKQPELKELTVGPHNVTRKAGQYVQFWAIAVYSNNQTQNVTKQAKWSTSDPSVATIVQQGNFIGVAQGKKAGEATITVTYAGKTATTKMTVTNPTITSVQISPAQWETPVGIPMQFQAVALFSDDSSQNITWQSSWTSSSTGVAQVGNGGGGGGPGGGGGGQNKGRVQAISPGTTEISATYQGFTGKATLTVSPAKMTGLQVFPGKQTMPVGDFRRFNAHLLWSDGKSTDVSNFVSWTSSDSGVGAALNGNGQKGLVQGLKPGTTTITAAGMGFKATGTLEVTTATVTSLQLTPGAASVAKGVPIPFKVVAVFSDGTSQDVTWQSTFTSSDNAVVSVNNGNGPLKGVALTLKAGTATVTATAKGLSASSVVTVKPAELKEIQLSPTNPSMVIGGFAKLEAVAIFTDDTTQQVTGLATWAAEKPEIIAASNQQGGFGKGIVQALKAGTTKITASWGGKSGSTTVTVQQAALVEIQVTPFSPVLPLGYTIQMQATGVFADNTTQNLTPFVSWTATSPKVATVSSANGQKGRLQPLSAGTTDVIATFGGKQGKTKVTVTAAELKSIAVAPSAVTLQLFAEANLTAVGTYADGVKFNLTPYVLWKSDNTGVAPVSNANGSKGEVKAIAQGKATITAIAGKISATAAVSVP